MASVYRSALMDALGPDEAQQKAKPVGPRLDLGAMGAEPGGYTGGGDTTAGPLEDKSAPAAAPTPAPAGDFSRLMGYDAGKFNDPNKQSAKYQIGRTLSGFDPRQGVTADVLNALNGLGLGTFTGSGDKLSLSGLTDKGKGAGLVGDYQNADFIGGFKGGNGKWTYADPAYEAANPTPDGGGGMAAAGGGAPFGGVGLDAALNGDPLARIQQLLGQLSGPRANLDALMAQLG